jgi:hypothetical protein
MCEEAEQTEQATPAPEQKFGREAVEADQGWQSLDTPTKAALSSGISRHARAPITSGVWQQPFDVLRAPLLTNLRMDPFERAREEDAMGYVRWYMEHMFAIAPAAAYVGKWIQSFKEFPPRQKPGGFNLDRAMQQLTAGSPGSQ